MTDYDRNHRPENEEEARTLYYAMYDVVRRMVQNRIKQFTRSTSGLRAICCQNVNFAANLVKTADF